MAEKKVKLLNQAGDELYPRTTMDNILTAVGSTVYANLVKLNGMGKIDAEYLPSYVDDVIELVAMSATAPAECATGDLYFNTTDSKIYEATAADTWSETGTDPEKGVIYLDLSNASSTKIYRWSGSQMIEIYEQYATVTSVSSDSTNTEVPTALATYNIASAMAASAAVEPAGSAGVATALGGVYVGSNIEVNAGGTISVATAGVGSAGVVGLAAVADVTTTATDETTAVTPKGVSNILSSFQPKLTTATNVTVDGNTITVANASESAKGVVELATTTEATTGTDTSRAVTPAGVAAVVANYQPKLTSTTNVTVSGNSISVADASTSAKGVVAIDETPNNGVALSVTGGTVKATMVAGTTAAVGAVQLATTTEASTGTIETKAVTPLGMATALGSYQAKLTNTTNITVSGNSISVADATSTTKGVAAFSTGTANGLTVAVNSATVSVSVSTASTSGVGTVQLATAAETSTGTNATKAVTPAGLSSAMAMNVWYAELT